MFKDLFENYRFKDLFQIVNKDTGITMTFFWLWVKRLAYICGDKIGKNEW